MRTALGLVLYLLLGLALVSLLINTVHARLARSFWRRTEAQLRRAARPPEAGDDRAALMPHEEESFDDEKEPQLYLESPLLSYSTVGIFQTRVSPFVPPAPHRTNSVW